VVFEVLPNIDLGSPADVVYYIIGARGRCWDT